MTLPRPLSALLVLSSLLSMSVKLNAQAIAPSKSQTQTDTALLYAAPEAHEDFENPKLARAVLTPITPLMIERADFPTYTRELWRVQWRTADPIDLYIILPKNVNKPPAILYLYGFPADTDRFLNDAYCKTVTARGLAAVGFVSALTGQRYHDRPWKQWFISELPEALGATTHDVQMIIDLLEKRSDLDTHRLGMFGQGSGATIALLAAAVDPRIRAVDLLDPWGDWPEWLQQSSLVPDSDHQTDTTTALSARLTKLDPLSRLPSLSATAVRLQQTSFDPNTPISIQKRLEKSMPPGADRLRYLDVSDYATRAASGGKILDWLSQRLSR